MEVIKNIRPAISPTCNMKCKYCYNKNTSFANMEDFRHSKLDNKILTTEEWCILLKCCYEAGYRGVCLTGGEPTMNPDWYKILTYCKELGYIQTELTSNLTLLDKYKNEISNTVISKFIVSFDSFNEDTFNYLTNSKSYNLVLNNIKWLVDNNFNVQLNRVCMKSNKSELLDYLKNASEMSVRVNLLDLVNYSFDGKNTSSVTWNEEFIEAKDTWDYINKNSNLLYDFKSNARYGYEAKFIKSNKTIIFKDSTLTKRAKRCFECKHFCQEGIYTLHLASDGTISTCPDYSNTLPFLDGIEMLEQGNLLNKLIDFNKELQIKEENYFNMFKEKVNEKN